MLEKKLLEELNRFKEINKYGKTMIMEQEATPPPPPTDDPAAAGAPPPPPADMGAGAPPPPPADMGAGAPPPSGLDTGTTGATPPPNDTTEEVDITDLVNMSKSMKDDVEKVKSDNSNVVGKMDDLFTKLDDLEKKLGDMNQIVAKIDELGAKVEANKPKSEVEKLEMRSLDSYPFNEKPQEFFAQKMGQMKASGKNEYVLTKDDVSNYPQDIKNTFNEKNDDDIDGYKF
jgi:hypothetical protein